MESGRYDGRKSDEMRKVTITRDYTKYAEGSVLIEFGDTKVICTASVDDKVPPFKKGSGEELGYCRIRYAAPFYGKQEQQGQEYPKD